MERRRRPVPYALFGAGLGVVVVVLVFLALTLDLTRDADLPDENAGGAPGSAAFDDAEPPLPGGPAAAPDADPSLARAPVTDLGTIPSADRLTVTITDPHGLLAHRHELTASGAGDLVCRKWRRAGEELRGEWSDEIHPPERVDLSFQALRPEFVRAASAALEPDPAGGWRATLDLSACAAIIEFTVTGELSVVAGCTLKAILMHERGQRTTLDLTLEAHEPLVVVSPVPAMIVTELEASGRNAQWAQRLVFPILDPGFHRYEVPASTGSVRVLVHEPAGPSNRALSRLHVEMRPTLERGGALGNRITEIVSDEVAFELVPPGRYELSCYEQQSGSRALIGARMIEVGAGETRVEFRSPEDRRTLTVRHAEPAGSEFWLLRAGVPADAARGALAREGVGTVVFESLDAAEWVVWMRSPRGVATARGDTRFVQDAETELGEVRMLSAVELQAAGEAGAAVGSVAVVLHEDGGRVLQMAWHPGRGQLQRVLPGLVEIRALRMDGFVAETTVLVPPDLPDASPFVIPLNFRRP